MNLKSKVRRAVQKAIVRRSSPVLLKFDNGVTAADPNDLATWSGVEAPQTLEVSGLVHFPSAATLLNRGFVELEQGDAIVDFPPSLSFAGRNNLTFEIDGVEYVQKGVGKQVLDYYDLLVGGERLLRTCVLTRK